MARPQRNGALPIVKMISSSLRMRRTSCGKIRDRRLRCFNRGAQNPGYGFEPFGCCVTTSIGLAHLAQRLEEHNAIFATGIAGSFEDMQVSETGHLIKQKEGLSLQIAVAIVDGIARRTNHHKCKPGMHKASLDLARGNVERALATDQDRGRGSDRY